MTALRGIVVLVAVSFGVLAPAIQAGADPVVQSNIAGNHEVMGSNSPGWYTGYLPKGDYHHLRLVYDRMATGQPEIVSLNEVCYSQAVNFNAFLNWAWPGQYTSRFANSFGSGGGPPGCAVSAPGGQVTGFGNLIIVRNGGYPAWGGDGYVKNIVPAFGGESKTWACLEGGAPSPRYIACSTHFWPQDIRNGFACSALPWLRDVVMNWVYGFHHSELVAGDLYLTRTPITNPSVGGTIDGCSSAGQPGMLTWWRSNFQVGSGPYDNSRTLASSSPQVDHILVDPGHTYAFGSGFTFSVGNCPSGTSFEQCNLTDHYLVRAAPNM